MSSPKHESSPRATSAAASPRHDAKPMEPGSPRKSERGSPSRASHTIVGAPAIVKTGGSPRANNPHAASPKGASHKAPSPKAPSLSMNGLPTVSAPIAPEVPLPPVDHVKVKIEHIMRNTPLDELSLKKIREQLSRDFGVDMTPMKGLIKETVDRLLEKLADDKKAEVESKPPKSRSKPSGSSSSSSQHQRSKGKDKDKEDDDNEDKKGSRKGAAKSKQSKAKASTSGGGGGTRKMMWMSEPLAAFMGTAQDAVDNPMECAKKIHQYAKEHELILPDQKAFFHTDDTLAKIFPKNKKIKTFLGAIVKVLKTCRAISYWQVNK